MQWKEEAPKCPACAAPAAAGAAECGACGVVFAKWKAKEARSAPSAREFAPAAVAPAPAGGNRVLGAILVAVSAGGFWGVLSSGTSKAPAAGAEPLTEYPGFSVAAPTGWTSTTLSACGGVGGACTVRVWERPDAPKDRYRPRIGVRLLPAEGVDDSTLVAGLAAEVAGETEAPAPAPKTVLVDGTGAVLLEARGRRHFRVETAAAVNVSATSVMADQMKANPGKGVYSVTATHDYSKEKGFINPGYVTLKPAEYADFDASPVSGRLLVRSRDKRMILGWDYDEAESRDADAVEETRAAIRVLSRPRFVDVHGGPLGPLSLAALAALCAVGAAGAKSLLG